MNADGYVSTGQDITGYNMFAYCGNNPVNREDPSGCGWIINLIKTVKRYLNNFTNFCSSKKANKTQKSSVITPVSSYSPKNKDGSYSLYDNQRKKLKIYFMSKYYLEIFHLPHCH